MSTATEELWIEDIKSGETEVFNQLISQYQQQIFKTINSIICNYEDAKDLTQEVFVKAFTKIDQFRADSKFSTWLYRIAINLSKNYLRRKKIVYFDSVDNNDIDLKDVSKVVDFVNKLEEDEAVRALYKALDSIDLKYRGVMILKEINQLKYEEIAEVTGLDIGTIKSRVFRAKQMLYRKLKDQVLL